MSELLEFKTIETFEAPGGGTIHAVIAGEQGTRDNLVLGGDILLDGEPRILIAVERFACLGHLPNETIGLLVKPQPNTESPVSEEQK